MVPILRPVLNEYRKLDIHRTESFFDSSLKYLMDNLKAEEVILEGTILCVSTIKEGSDNPECPLEDRAFLTARSLSRFVPTAIGGIIVNSTNMEDRENVDALALSRLREFKNPWRINCRVA